MWCAHCQSEVAAEVAGDNRRIHCASCGQEIASSRERRPVSATREARELLERWSNERIVDPYGPLHSSPKHPIAAAASSTESPTESTTDSDKPSETATAGSERTTRLRIDATPPRGTAENEPQNTRETPVESTQPSAPKPASVESERTEPVSPSRPFIRVHQAHSAPAPHIPAPAPAPPSAPESPEPQINWMSVAGQWLSYIGVLALTSGTGFVLLGHFRGPASYVATGWLITMAGQMLLFLGVMTTFSTGIEKTTDTVSRKIDDLGDRIIRIEEAARALHRAAPETPHERSEPSSRAESA